ncbi:MAG: DUF2157 domain-containing protein [Negativicutes bacterium]|nr:DUF2157 domain-containing protein [Negativicutes bacterium]
MNKKALAALYQDLPDLVAKGILSPESAERLKQHYGPLGESQGNKTFLLVFGVFGVILVGLGIILLLAHNWPQFTRITRLAISIGLLFTAQAVSGLALRFKPDSRIWREAAATFHTLALGAALALIGQTYHLTEDTDMFVLTWMLLSLPLVYLLRSGSAAVLYCIGITFWVTNVHEQSGRHLIWVLYLLALPFYWQRLRQDRQANATAILSWAFNISLFISFGAAFAAAVDNLGLLLYSALFSLNYMAGMFWFNTAGEKWRMPFKIIGIGGSIACAYILTFQDIWRHLNVKLQNMFTPDLMLLAALMLLAVAGNIRMAQQFGRNSLPLAAIPLVTSAAYISLGFDASGAGAAVLLNSYLLLLSIWIIRKGIRQAGLGLVNLGMTLLAALIAARFFDANVSFLIRGLVFVALGAGFLITNWFIVSRRNTGG